MEHTSDGESYWTPLTKTVPDSPRLFSKLRTRYPAYPVRFPRPDRFPRWNSLPPRVGRFNTRSSAPRDSDRLYRRRRYGDYPVPDYLKDGYLKDDNPKDTPRNCHRHFHRFARDVGADFSSSSARPFQPSTTSNNAQNARNPCHHWKGELLRPFGYDVLDGTGRLDRDITLSPSPSLSPPSYYCSGSSTISSLDLGDSGDLLYSARSHGLAGKKVEERGGLTRLVACGGECAYSLEILSSAKQEAKPPQTTPVIDKNSSRESPAFFEPTARGDLPGLSDSWINRFLDAEVQRSCEKSALPSHQDGKVTTIEQQCQPNLGAHGLSTSSIFDEPIPDHGTSRYSSRPDFAPRYGGLRTVDIARKLARQGCQIWMLEREVAALKAAAAHADILRAEDSPSSGITNPTQGQTEGLGGMKLHREVRGECGSDGYDEHGITRGTIAPSPSLVSTQRSSSTTRMTPPEQDDVELKVDAREE